MKPLTLSVVLILAIVLLAAGLAVSQPAPPQGALKAGDTAPDLKLQASDGNEYELAQFGGAQIPKNLFMSAPDCVQFFVEANECATPGTDTVDAVAGVTRTLCTGGTDGTEVEFVIVDNCGHNWPTPQQGLSASQTLWDFFAAHPKVQAADGAAGG